MIKDLYNIITELKELAEVLNSFKSEAVQLRIIDLLIGGAPLAAMPETPPAVDAPAKAAAAPKARRRSRKAAKADTSPNTPTKPARAPVKGRPGGKATLDTLVADGFFESPKTIRQIVEHCDTSLAMKYKQSDFSGPLMRFIREKRLTRTRNEDGQYEYVAA